MTGKRYAWRPTSAGLSPTWFSSRPIRRRANRASSPPRRIRRARFRNGRPRRHQEGRRRSALDRLPRPRHDGGDQRADRAQGRQVGLIATEGFRDTLEIARGNRPDFFNLHYQKPKPFVPRYLRRELPGRMSYKGEEMKPLDLSGLPAILSDFKADGIEAIAICFLHSYANISHEAAAQEEVRRLWPGFRSSPPPDHPGMARIRTHQHGRALRLCAADGRALSRPP